MSVGNGGFVSIVLQDEKAKAYVIGKALAELMTEGKETNDAQTALELLLVKHTVLAVQKAQTNVATLDT